MNDILQHRVEALAEGSPATQQESILIAKELLRTRLLIAQLQQQLSAQIRLPVCSSSPVCEVDAAYAAGVNDCKEVIRRAGYPVEGDD